MPTATPPEDNPPPQPPPLLPPLPPPIEEDAVAAAADTAVAVAEDGNNGNDPSASDAAAAAVAAASSGADGDANAETADTNAEDAAASSAKKKAKKLKLKRVNKLSFNLKSDIEDDNERDATPSGVLHACKTSASREEHAFAWVEYINDTNATRALVDFLGKYGFRPSVMKFIPFSNRDDWVAKYPHAKIFLECGEDGVVQADEQWEMEHGSEAKDAAKKKKKAKKAAAAAAKKKAKSRKAPPKLLGKGKLPDAERDELHREIYNYFTWLYDELAEMETHTTGRRLVSTAGVSVPALQGLLGKLEGAFRVVLHEKIGKENARQSGVNNNSMPPVKELPFLETSTGLETELQQIVLEKIPDPSTTAAKKSAASREKQAWRNLDFDTLFQKLVAYKEEEGNADPPYKNAELGRWVQELRANKKKLQERGLAWEPEEDDDSQDANMETEDQDMEGDDETSADAAVSGTESPPRKRRRRRVDLPRTNTYLTRDRVLRLNSISFSWALMPARVSWDQRFEELKQFKEIHGRWPTTKEGTIGGWLKAQRRLYTKNDADFMANKYHRFQEIGLPLRQNNYTCMSWEDRFQQLVEFGRVNRHFNVPNPLREGGNSRYLKDLSPEVAEANRFYKFVAKLHQDYRAITRGVDVPSHNMLTEERIAQLRNIGFDFYKKSEKTVPQIDWSTRMQQLEAFQSEMGHMRVDPNYGMYSNLGGWAVEISEQYKIWQEGRYQPPDMVEKFNQLSAMGFGFDVFPTRRGERSWEDSFNLLLQYRQETGTTRVPHHYKADFRLGSWVAVQRKEYKLLVEGKTSRLTQERIQKLESIGFEWSVKRGHADD